ncbi:MAG: trimethylamine methyltransferase family protein [Gammaproteobacteria bacterium]
MKRKRTKRGEAGGIQQRPWAPAHNPWPPLDILRAEDVQAIDRAAMKILAEIGLQFRHAESLEVLDQHGAHVDFDSNLVKFDAELIRKHIANAPPSFELHARNAQKNADIGGNRIHFAPVSGPPSISDLDRGRRPGTYRDQCDLIRLTYCLNALHLGGGSSVEAMDLPADTRHLDFYRAQTVLSDQIWNARGIGRPRVSDAIEINCIARNIDHAGLRAAPGLLTVINVNSPLVVDKEMLAGLTEMTLHGQPCVITPFTLAGAMSPVTLAGALAQQTAEALAVLALVQMLRPGCPCVFGGFTSNVDMKSGSPAFGTPEYVRGVLAGGQLARHYGLPYRSSNVNACNTADAQATYESAMSLWACFLAHANIVNHAAGWMEGGLCASMEKFIIDAEMIQTLCAAFEPIAINEAEFGLDAIVQAGHGGHFFGTDHTMARYRTAFYQPLLSDWSNFENWRDAGAKDATQRANEIWKALLADYREPHIEPRAVAEIDRFIARRKGEIAKVGVV